MRTHRSTPWGTFARRTIAAFALAVIALTSIAGSALAQGTDPVDPDEYRRQRDEWLAEQARQQQQRDEEMLEQDTVPAGEMCAVGFRFGWANSDQVNGVTAGLSGNFWVGEMDPDYRIGVRPSFYYASYRGIGTPLVTARNTNFHDFQLFVDLYIEKNMPNEGLGGMFAPFFFVGPGYEMFDGTKVKFTQGFIFDVGAGVRMGQPQSAMVFEAAYARGFGDLKANNVRVTIGLDWGF